MSDLPAEIAAAADLTTARALERAALRWPDRPALLIDGIRLTWAQIHAAALQDAAALLAHGIMAGERIAILSPNSADYARLIYAAGMIGASVITLNARFKTEDLAYALRHADAACLIIGGQARGFMDFRAMLGEICPDLTAWDGRAPLALADLPALRLLFNFDDPEPGPWPDKAAFRAAARPAGITAARALQAQVPASAEALVIYSSGTTARPKACALSHANLSQIGTAFARRFRLGERDVIYNPMPFFHMSTMLPMAACRASGALQICTAHYKPAEALAQMAAERVTFGYVSFPTILSGLLDHPDFAQTDLSALRLVHCVGPQDLLRRYGQSLPQARFVNAYGLTEGSGVAVWSDPDDPQDDPFTLSGKPLEGLQIAAFDPETDALLPPDTRGELRLKGYCRFMGYLHDPEATARVLRADGWLATGDLGHISPAGFVTYDGRLKDMLKIGGENVAALEIESYLCRHPKIKLAQVIAVPDAHLFEVAAAYIELVPDAQMEAEEVITHCLGQIASYKVPRYVRFIRDWPMSTTKIQKFALPRDFAPSDYIDVKARMAQLRAAGGAG